MSNEHFDCIVFGAGIAGITAARELKNKGKKVLLLEATENVGGRMRSVDDFVRTDDGSKVRKGFPIEEGAHFIHVGYTMAKETKGPFKKDIEGKPYKKFWAEIRKHKFKSEGLFKGTKVQVAFPVDWEKPKIALEAYLFDKDLQKVGNFISGLFPKIKRFNLKGEDQPAGEFVKSLGYNGKAVPMAMYATSAHTPGLLADHHAYLVPPKHPGPCKPVKDNISVAGLKVDNIPQQLGDEWYEYRMKGPDGEHCGFDELPKAILEEFKQGEPGKTKGMFLPQHEVTKVDAFGEGVMVTAKKLAVKNKPEVKFTADSAICTFSVGVLMHSMYSHNPIFDKQFFPEEKQKVFEIIKPGPLAKFSLQFKECVWGNDNEIINNQPAILCNPTGANLINPEEHGLRTFFVSFPHQKDGPYVLTALLMGVDYLAIRDKDDEEAAKYIFEIVEGLYNPNHSGNRWDMKEKLVYSNSKGKPNVHRKDWGRDEWARGGNSYISYNENKSVKEITEVRETLKSPLKTLPVFWAGEATAPAYNQRYQPLSVHGAYISGIEVAKDVARYLMKSDDFEQYYKKKYEEISA